MPVWSMRGTLGLAVSVLMCVGIWFSSAANFAASAPVDLSPNNSQVNKDNRLKSLKEIDQVPELSLNAGDLLTRREPVVVPAGSYLTLTIPQGFSVKSLGLSLKDLELFCYLFGNGWKIKSKLPTDTATKSKSPKSTDLLVTYDDRQEVLTLKPNGELLGETSARAPTRLMTLSPPAMKLLLSQESLSLPRLVYETKRDGTALLKAIPLESIKESNSSTEMSLRIERKSPAKKGVKSGYGNSVTIEFSRPDAWQSRSAAHIATNPAELATPSEPALCNSAPEDCPNISNIQAQLDSIEERLRSNLFGVRQQARRELATLTASMMLNNSACSWIAVLEVIFGYLRNKSPDAEQEASYREIEDHYNRLHCGSDRANSCCTEANPCGCDRDSECRYSIVLPQENVKESCCAKKTTSPCGDEYACGCTVEKPECRAVGEKKECCERASFQCGLDLCCPEEADCRTREDDGEKFCCYPGAPPSCGQFICGCEEGKTCRTLSHGEEICCPKSKVGPECGGGIPCGCSINEKCIDLADWGKRCCPDGSSGIRCGESRCGCTSSQECIDGECVAKIPEQPADEPTAEPVEASLTPSPVRGPDGSTTSPLEISWSPTPESNESPLGIAFTPSRPPSTDATVIHSLEETPAH
jgi:hypothetical protein